MNKFNLLKKECLFSIKVTPAPPLHLSVKTDDFKSIVGRKKLKVKNKKQKKQKKKNNNERIV